MKKIMSMCSTVVILFICIFAFSGCTQKENIVNITIDENVNNSNDITNITEQNLQNGKVDIKNKNSYYFVIDGKKYTTESKLKDIKDIGIVQDASTVQAEIQRKTFYIGGAYFRAESNNRTVFSVIPVIIQKTLLHVLMQILVDLM